MEAGFCGGLWNKTAPDTLFLRLRFKTALNRRKVQCHDRHECWQEDDGS
jgi:hypothetical protein